MSAPSRRLEVLHSHLEPLVANHDASESSAPAVAVQACLAAAGAVPPAAAGPPVLVGGMVMDLQAHPSGPADVRRGGSVPGRVTQSPGGVARNVGEALALLLKSAGAAAASQLPLPLLVSAVGDDLAGRALLQHWRSLGMSTDCIAQLAGGATPTVSVVFDLGGEVAACVADVQLLEARLLPPLLRQPRVAAALRCAPVVMLDANLATTALEEVCRQAAAAGVPVWFEPVSVPKSVRATSLLSLLSYVSPNEAELAAMAAAARQQQALQPPGGSMQGRSSGSSGAGSSCSTDPPPGAVAAAAGGGAPALAAAGGAEAALRAVLPDVATLLRTGVRHVVLTMGGDGAALCTLAPGGQAVSACLMPALPAKVVNCSGAGDCLVAGCLFALSTSRGPEEALAHGIAAAAAAVESRSNVPPGLGAETARRGAAVALARRRVLRLSLEGV